MENSLRWERRIFSGTSNIFANGTIIGSLVNQQSAESTDGIINGKSYSFKTVGIFKQKTIIFDEKTSKAIGEITFNNWMNKAELIINNEKYSWKYDNIWKTKWSINKPNDGLITNFGSITSGQIYSDTDDGLLLLSGMFVNSLYHRMTVIIILFILMFLPIIIL